MDAEENVLFREVQRFRQWWLWAIVLGSTLPVAAVLAYGMIMQLLLKREWFGSFGSGEPDAELLVGGAIGIAITLLVLCLFWRTRLITEVRTGGLYVRFVPFHFSFKRIGLEQATSIEAVTYRPILRYGGWGIRWARGGKAYNVSGNRGVRLSFASGRHLLIGSQQPGELARAIESISNV